MYWETLHAKCYFRCPEHKERDLGPAFQELTDFAEDDDVNVISPRLGYKAQRWEERGRRKQPGEVRQGRRINFPSESWRFTS